MVFDAIGGRPRRGSGGLGAPANLRPSSLARVRHAAEVFPRAFLAAVGAQPPPTRNRRRAVQRRIGHTFFARNVQQLPWRLAFAAPIQWAAGGTARGPWR